MKISRNHVYAGKPLLNNMCKAINKYLYQILEQDLSDLI